MSLSAELPGSASEELALGAATVLRDNDMGGWTRASDGLYPHQWSWDTGFIAIGLAHLDVERASRELLGLFENQWTNGKVPHIVFNPEAPLDSYFPGAEHWSSACQFPGAPPFTSALCQPPVHAIAAERIYEIACESGKESVAREFLGGIYPKLFHWHRYLLTVRDPEGSGLVTIYHPWESGMDNSPRWDAAMARIEVGDMPSYSRRDLRHVNDPTERPTGIEYDRFIWLVELIKRERCDEVRLAEVHPFVVKDVMASAILVAANEALLRIAKKTGAPPEDLEVLRGWIRRGTDGLEDRWDGESGLCLDYDLRAGESLRTSTIGGFAPLISGHLPPERMQRLLSGLTAEWFGGHPSLRWKLPPSSAPEQVGFQPRNYWRGPVWPVMTWLLWWSLRQTGETRVSENLRRSGLDQLASGGFAEYFEPFTGSPLGSPRQSWTAAVALDWLAAEPLNSRLK